MATQASRNPAQVQVQTEEESGWGWRYRVTITRDGAGSEHTVTLSWADHEYWCGGRLPPSSVVEGVIRYVAERRVDLPVKFDAATCRRWYREIDREMSLMGGIDAG
ncbi:MAG: hypothetical protein IT437_06900 [Phycisphaerales bacterium]|nr:hypothetical protein [Phycisphaerales bacterium]